MRNIYKILRDIGIRLAGTNESIPLLEKAAQAAQELIKAKEVYALVLDENGHFQLSYNSTSASKSIEALCEEITASGCNSASVTTCLNRNGHVCIWLSTSHLIYLVSCECSPAQNEMLELFREQTSLQLNGILQHEKTETDLRNSKNKYRSLLESQHEGILVLDKNAYTSFANPQMAQMLGYTIEEMLGKHLFAFMDEEWAEFAASAIGRRKQGIREQFPFTFIKKDGQPLHTLIATSPIMKNGRYAGAIAGIMDITERYHALEELRYSEKRFRDLVETTSDWIWEVDANWVYTYSSKIITNLLGYTPEEIIGTTPFDLMMPEEAERVGKLFADIIAKKRPFTHLLNVNKHKNGQFIPISTAGVPILDTDGELLGYRGIDRDITALIKQKEKRAKAKRQTQLLLSVLEGIGLASSFDAALEIALRLISEHTNWLYGEAWIIDREKDELFCQTQYMATTHKARLDIFYNLSSHTRFAVGDGVPGRVWLSQKKIWHENVQILPTDTYLRLDAVKTAGLKAVLATPVLSGNKTMAVLMFYVDNIQEKESEEMELITAVVSQLGLILRQKQTEETLRKLSRAVEQGATSIFITNLNGEIEFVNPAFSKITGYGRVEVLGKTPAILRSENTPDSEYHALWTALQKGDVWEGRLENRRKDGTLVWLQSIISTIKNDRGNLTHYLCIQSDITEQMAVETALLASEEKNRGLIKAIPDILFLLNKDGTLLANYGIEEGLFLSPEAFINKNIREVVPPAVYEPTFIAIEAALRTGEMQQYSYALSIDNGTSTNHYDARVTVVESDRLLMIVRDVTVQRQAEDALRESQQNLSKAQELAHLGSWKWDILSGEISWSDETYRIFGHAPQNFEASYEKFLEMVHPEDVIKLETAVQHSLNTQEPYTIEHRTKRPSGEIRYVREQGEVICNKDGDIIRMIGAVLDITEQTIARQKLEEAKENALQSTLKLAKAQELAHLGSWARVVGSGVNTWSDEMYRIFGHEPQSFVATPSVFLSMIHPDDLETVKTAVWQNETNGTPYTLEYRIRLKSGEIRHMRGYGEPVYENGVITHVIGGVLDITKQVIAQQKLEQAKETAQELQLEAERANRAKSNFLTNMSHELRTPLNGILGYTQLFKQDKSLSVQQLHGIDVIHHSGEHLLFMINDMLDLAKIEAGKMSLNVTECHLPKMLTALADMVSQSAQQKGLAFSHHMAEDIPLVVMTDGIRLRQILLNLLSNAVKFTDTGLVLLEVFPIETAVSLTSIKLRFRVEDTGTGIAPESIETIFSPFEQVNLKKDGTSGTGLGLAISRRLTSLLGGTLNVSSRLNEGSVFWLDVELSIAKDNEGTKQAIDYMPTTIVGVKGDKKIRLLIVDDIESNRLVLTSYFSMLSGFDLMEAVDGEDAVAKTKQFKPHLILMDLMMPMMDGMEATRQIRLLPTVEKSIIIATTANAYADIEEQTLKTGFDGYIAKPFELTELAKQIQTFLGGEWEWLYSQQTTQSDDNKVEMPIISLPEEETAVLLELAKNGDIKNLRNTFSTYKKELDPQYHPLIDKLTEFAQQYRVKQIREQLEK